MTGATLTNAPLTSANTTGSGVTRLAETGIFILLAVLVHLFVFLQLEGGAPLGKGDPSGGAALSGGTTGELAELIESWDASPEFRDVSELQDQPEAELDPEVTPETLDETVRADAPQPVEPVTPDRADQAPVIERLAEPTVSELAAPAPVQPPQSLPPRPTPQQSDPSFALEAPTSLQAAPLPLRTETQTRQDEPEPDPVKRAEINPLAPVPATEAPAIDRPAPPETVARQPAQPQLSQPSPAAPSALPEVPREAEPEPQTPGVPRPPRAKPRALAEAAAQKQQQERAEARERRRVAEERRRQENARRQAEAAKNAKTTTEPAEKDGAGGQSEDTAASGDGSGQRAAEKGAGGTADTDSYSQAAIVSAERTFVAAVRRAIERKKRYPRSAQRRGISGQSTVRIVIDASGRLVSATLANSSGKEILDEAAVAAVNAVGRFPAIPAEMSRNQVAIALPITFQSR